MLTESKDGMTDMLKIVYPLKLPFYRGYNEEFVQLLYAQWWTTQQTFIKKFCQNTCSETAIQTYFHFSCYKSMETLSCHSNKSTWATAIKNTLFVEANIMNIYALFQLHPSNDFWVVWGDDFWIFFRKSILLITMATNQTNSAVWTKFVCLVEDYLRNIFIKFLSKYLLWESNKCLFSFFPI